MHSSDFIVKNFNSPRIFQKSLKIKYNDANLVLN